MQFAMNSIFPMSKPILKIVIFLSATTNKTQPLFHLLTPLVCLLYKHYTAKQINCQPNRQASYEQPFYHGEVGVCVDVLNPPTQALPMSIDILQS